MRGGQSLLQSSQRRYSYALPEDKSLLIHADVRQCVLYDSPGPNARLIGVEYMISPRLYENLDTEERKLWHSHVFEVKSGMLIMPQPQTVLDTHLPSLSSGSEAPPSAWELAETKEMEDVIKIYGKVYHLWQTDRGDALPLGEPKLMTSYTAADQFDLEKIVRERDERFGTDYKRKAEVRRHIEEPTVHADADQAWK